MFTKFISYTLLESIVEHFWQTVPFLFCGFYLAFCEKDPSNMTQLEPTYLSRTILNCIHCGTHAHDVSVNVNVWHGQV